LKAVYMSDTEPKTETDTGEWPERWPEWVKAVLRDLETSADEIGPIGANDAPAWVERLQLELAKQSIPTIKIDRPGDSGPALLGRIVGHHTWLESSDNGVVAQLERFEKTAQELESALKQKLGIDEYESRLEQSAPLMADMETMWNNITKAWEEKTKICTRATASALEQKIDEQSEFFAAYTDALNHPVFDENGRASIETYASLTNIYLLVVIFWRTVVLMGSRKELYDWLCQSLGKSQVGEFERVETICKRQKIRLATRGRPKHKKRS
jgi:hypothetical protein